MKKLRLVFMGTPNIAVPALEALLSAGHEIVGVYTQPPRPAGRGHRDRLSPVHRVASERGLIIRHPNQLNDSAEALQITSLDADAAVVIAYGLILPKAFLEAPRLGCLNIHMSLLPRWRGAAPIQRAIIAGDSETGVTIMQMDEGLDTGPILSSRSITISHVATSQTLHDQLSALGADLVVETLNFLSVGEIVAKSQNNNDATYAKKLSRDEGQLDWRLSAAELDRYIRGLNPAPGTWFEHDGERIRVLAAEPVQAIKSTQPGEILDAAPTIACGDGNLRLASMQRSGKSVLPAADFLRGYTLPIGCVLGLPGKSSS